MFQQPFEDFMQDNVTELRKKIVVNCYIGQMGHTYSQGEDFDVRDGVIIATSLRFKDMLIETV